MIKLIDVGIGNIVSVENWLRRNQVNVEVIKDDEKWSANDTIIFPGVGNSVSFTSQIKKWPLLIDSLKDGKYEKLVGICSGFQSLCETVSEGDDQIKGLGLISAVSRPLPNKTFHTGWEAAKHIYPHISDRKDLRRAVYFNHGCAVYPYRRDGSFTYDKKNSYAIGLFTKKMVLMQFHPEKSGHWGDLIACGIFND